MISNKYLPSLVSGFGAAVLVTIPGFENMGWCLIVPFASVITLFLHQKVNKADLPLKGSTAIKFGILTGFYAAVFSTLFDLIITYLTKSNYFVSMIPQIEVMIRNLQIGPLGDQVIQTYKQIEQQITTTGFSLQYSIGRLIGFGFIYSIFGLLGSLLGMALVNRRAQR